MSNTSVETVSNSGDKIKFILAILIVVASVFAYSYFSDMNVYARVGIFVGGLVLGLIIVWTTEAGKRGLGFLVASYNELKRVVWPTRNETIRMTGVVFAFVAVMALFLWIIDKLIGWIVYGVFLGWS